MGDFIQMKLVTNKIKEHGWLGLEWRLPIMNEVHDFIWWRVGELIHQFLIPEDWKARWEDLGEINH